MPKQIKHKPFGDGKYTEAAFWGFIRSALRRKSMHWPPVANAKKAARRAYKGPNKRQKWEYKCAHCHNYFKGEDIDVDHINECGTLNEKTAGEFILRLFCPSSGLQVLCKTCHHKKTHDGNRR
jgi:5-methylcytosine-specific restriction endonuclease McrA